MADKEPLRWEEAAQWGLWPGWRCVRCNVFYGTGDNAERAARYCCHTDSPCECGGRNTNKNYLYCGACMDRKEQEQWAALPRVEWDGGTPLCLWRGERFFFNVEDLENYLGDDPDGDDPPRRLEDLRLVLCEESEKRSFDAGDFLFDHMGEDFEAGDHGGDEIEKLVNDWIAGLPKTYHPTGKAVTLESLQRHLAPCVEVDRGRAGDRDGG